MPILGPPVRDWVDTKRLRNWCVQGSKQLPGQDMDSTWVRFIANRENMRKQKVYCLSRWMRGTKRRKRIKTQTFNFTTAWGAAYMSLPYCVWLKGVMMRPRNSSNRALTLALLTFQAKTILLPCAMLTDWPSYASSRRDMKRQRLCSSGLWRAGSSSQAKTIPTR